MNSYMFSDSVKIVRFYLLFMYNIIKKTVFISLNNKFLFTNK